MHRVLSVAGSDPSGGAGIQADLKTFTTLRAYGMTAITAITVQDTRGVDRIFEIPADLVRQQIDAVLTDIGAQAAKTGMLFSAQTAIATAKALRDHHVERLVVDPVFVSTSGAPLAEPDLPQALLAEVIPQALLVTPNIAEATVLTGIGIETLADMHAAAAKLIDSGARACLVKGGHLAGPAIDVLMVGRTARELVAERVITANTHGTGCQLSAAIATFLAQGKPLEEAVADGKAFITKAIAGGLALGKGVGPANPLAWNVEGEKV